MTEMMTKGEFFRLINEISYILSANKMIPLRFDTACQRTLQANKSKSTELLAKSNEINDLYADKNEDGTTKIETDEKGNRRYVIANEKDRNLAMESLFSEKVNVIVHRVHPHDLGHVVIDKSFSDFRTFEKYMVSDG
jgi:hypothetical protein